MIIVVYVWMIILVSIAEQTSNECLSNPCLNNGTCVDHIWNYTCQCSTGFTGSNCQIERNYCESSPCIKGLCVNKVNTTIKKNRSSTVL